MIIEAGGKCACCESVPCVVRLRVVSGDSWRFVVIFRTHLSNVWMCSFTFVIWSTVVIVKLFFEDSYEF